MDYYSIIDRIAYHFDMQRRRKRANSRVINLPQTKLSRNEKKIFSQNWNGWGSDSYRFYKAFCGIFDVNNVPNDYYDYAEHVLNLRWSAFFLQQKCNLGYFVPKENRPETILRKIDGHYIVEGSKELAESEAKELLLSEGVFVKKVALGTGGGHGVEKVDFSRVEAKDISLLFDKMLRHKDLLFQKVLVQSDFMSQFNPDSINTFRIISLNINGNCTTLIPFFRMGAKGAFVDNLMTGGGVLTGVSRDGCLSSFGITKSFQKVPCSPSGVRFEGIRVPDWEDINKKNIGFHKNIPHANLIGWDVAIGKNGEPIIIEINLDSATLECHQIFETGIFGDRLLEVKEYIKDRERLLRHAMITY